MKNISELAPDVARRRRIAEIMATIGMILIGVGMLLPLFNLMDVAGLTTFRWVFASGSLLFWAARCIPVSSPQESVRLRRLRRMEFWSGACFGVATFFWFYNSAKFGSTPYVGSLMILRDTIMFALAGAMLQLVAAWMIYYRQKKDREDKPAGKSMRKGDRD